MTDPEWADATYLEPLDAETVAEVIERERPDAILPTLGGQTALNLAVELARGGCSRVRRRADRRRPRRDPPRRGPLALPRRRVAAGLPVPRPRSSRPRARRRTFPVPAIVRPAFTLGGTRRRHRARRRRSSRRAIAHGLAASPVGQVLVEESLAGWQEHELEVMCDARGQRVVVCSIENLDPMGVHTGDSWTVAPQQTLPDAEYQRLREAAFASARAVGVATGGANVQFAVRARRRASSRVIEMNPRVSRSSALASKATGFPIAKLAALLAVGYTLDELPNDITRQDDRRVRAGARLRRGQGAALRLREVPARRRPARRRDARRRRGARARPHVRRGVPEGAGRARASRTPATIELSRGAASRCRSAGTCCSRRRGAGSTCPASTRTSPTSCARSRRRAAAAGDRGEAVRLSSRARARRARRPPGRLAVDSCAGEFEARTPYYYLTYEGVGRGAGAVGPGGRRARRGAEPDRPGDRVRLLLRPRRAGAPQARLRGGARQLEPRDGLDRLRHLRPPLPRAAHARARARRLRARAAARRRRLLRRPDAAAPRARRSPPPACRCSATRSTRSTRPRTAAASRSCSASSACAPEWGAAEDAAEAREVAERIGYPVLVRPHHVIGGRGMHVARSAGRARRRRPVPRRPLPRGRARARRRRALRRRGTRGSRRCSSTSSRAGVHSGDSACVAARAVGDARARGRDPRRPRRDRRAGSARAGCSTSSSRSHGGELYVLEANPRASRTVPFVAKATGRAARRARRAACCSASRSRALGLPERAVPSRAWAKEAVFPAERFAGAARAGPRCARPAR